MTFGSLELRPYRGVVSKALALGLLATGALGQEVNKDLPTVVDDRCGNMDCAVSSEVVDRVHDTIIANILTVGIWTARQIIYQGLLTTHVRLCCFFHRMLVGLDIQLHASVSL